MDAGRESRNVRSFADGLITGCEEWKSAMRVTDAFDLEHNRGKDPFLAARDVGIAMSGHGGGNSIARCAHFKKRAMCLDRLLEKAIELPDSSVSWVVETHDQLFALRLTPMI